MGFENIAQRNSSPLSCVRFPLLHFGYYQVTAGHHTGHMFSTALMFSPLTCVKAKSRASEVVLSVA